MTIAKHRPISKRPGPTAEPLSTREEMASVLAGAWMVVGLFLDGLAHVELEPESFFTPSHLVLYSGFVVATVAGILPVLRRHRAGNPWVNAVPVGHAVTLGGVALFGLGAVLDLVWHETIGIEVSNEALLSPTHLVLLVGGLAALSGPLRNGLRGLGPGSTRTEWWPASGSLALVSSVAIFFTSYLSPFGREAAASFPTTRTHTHELNVANADAFNQLREIWGIAGVITTTMILVVALLVLLRPALPPVGIITAVFLWLALVAPAIGEYQQWFAALAVAAGGLATDLVARKIAAAPALAATLGATTWSVYFAALAISGDLAWSPALWSGAVFLGVLLAALLGWLATPPPNRRRPQTTSPGTSNGGD